MTLCLNDRSKTVFRDVNLIESDGVDKLLLGRSYFDKISFTLVDFLKEISGHL